MLTNRKSTTQHRGIAPKVRRVLTLLMLLASFGLPCLHVSAQAPNEYRVKAAFILNFARFIEWPNDAYGDGSWLVVGIVGDDPFGGSFDQLNGNMINGRRIAIKHLKATDYLKGCQVLFVSSSERGRLGKILESVRGGSVLTIGELSQFNQAGGVIKFVIQDDKVRFEINPAAVRQARLKVSSKLLALSRN
jgi:hypothetical protein